MYKKIVSSPEEIQKAQIISIYQKMANTKESPYLLQPQLTKSTAPMTTHLLGIEAFISEIKEVLPKTTNEYSAIAHEASKAQILMSTIDQLDHKIAVDQLVPMIRLLATLFIVYDEQSNLPFPATFYQRKGTATLVRSFEDALNSIKMAILTLRKDLIAEEHNKLFIPADIKGNQYLLYLERIATPW